MDPVERRMRDALKGHGLDPDEPGIDKTIKWIMQVMGPEYQTPNCPLCSEPPGRVIGNLGLCYTDDCPAITWDMTMHIDQLIETAGSVRITHVEPPGDEQ